MYVIQSNIATNDTTKPFLVRDQLIQNDNGGVKLLFDFGFGWSYPAGDLPRPLIVNPVNNAIVRDMSNAKNNGSVDLSATAGTMTHDGKGVVKSKVAQTNHYSTINATGVLSSFTGTTKFIVCAYVKLADLTLFTPTGGSLSSFISACDHGKTYNNDSELVFIATLPKNAEGNGAITARFQKSIGSIATLNVVLPQGLNLYDFDLVQIAAWTDGEKCYLRVKSELFESTVEAAFTGNSASVAGKSIAFDTSKGHFGGSSVPHKLYRGFVENLTVSGRDPITVLNADYHRVVARGVFS